MCLTRIEKTGFGRPGGEGDMCMVEEVPKRLSIAEKRAMATPLVLTPERKVEEFEVEALSTDGLGRCVDARPDAEEADLAAG
jgi:hypothetical protein